MAPKGISKPKQVKTGRKKPVKAQQPIHLPSDALAEVFKFFPRSHRAKLALVSFQADASITPGVKAERRKLLATAPGVIAGHRAKIAEITEQCEALLNRSVLLTDECEAESTRLLDTEPPSFLMQGCRLTTLGRAGRPLMKMIRAHTARNRQIAERIHEINRRGDELAGEAELGVLVELSEKAAESSRLKAEQCELDVAIRRVETQLWQMGVQIRSPKEDTILYATARSLDDSLTTLCADYTRLAACYRVKREMELAMAGLYRQLLGLEGKLKRVQDEYEATKAREQAERV